MTTLFVVHNAPYPPRSGSRLRSWTNINVMARCGPVHMFSVGLREPDATTMPVVARWIHVDPADYPRCTHSVTSRALSAISSRQFPVDGDIAVTGDLNRRLESFIAETRPDCIVLSNWVDAYPDALKRFPFVIVDAHNIESLLGREIRAANQSTCVSLASVVMRCREWRWRRRERRRERNLLRQARSIWVASKEDARILRELDNKLPEPVIWPNVIDVDYYASVREGKTTPPDGLKRDGLTIAYIGLFSYPPNRRAAATLVEEIFPKVAEQVSQARLLLVGQEPTPAMLAAAAARDSKIVVTGGVPDVRPYLGLADICVVPLTEGGGTRLKILEAFASHVPVVSTTKGAEGLEAENGKHIVIAEDPISIAEAIITLSTDLERRRAQVRDAFALVSERYSLDSLARRLEEALPAMSSAAS
jgi:glycosyltransferase involved in cell wall biosynthesis